MQQHFSIHRPSWHAGQASTTAAQCSAAGSCGNRNSPLQLPLLPPLLRRALLVAAAALAAAPPAALAAAAALRLRRRAALLHPPSALLSLQGANGAHIKNAACRAAQNMGHRQQRRRRQLPPAGAAAADGAVGAGLRVAPADLRRAVWMHCREAQAALSRRVKRSATPRQLWWAPPGSGHRIRLLGAARADSGGRACCLAQLPGASLSWYPPGASCRPPPTVRATCRQQRGCGQRQTRPGLHLPPAQQQSANSSVAAARAALLMLLASVVVWLRARATAARSRQAGGPAAARAAAQGRSPDPRSHSPLLRRPAPAYALSDAYMRVPLLCGGFIVPSRRLGFGFHAPLVPRPWVCLQLLWLRSLTSTTQRAGAAGPQVASVLAAHVPAGAGRHRCASGSAHPCHV